MALVNRQETISREARDLPAVLSLDEIREETDPLTRIQAADVLVRYRQGSPLRVAFPKDPNDPGHDVAFESLRDVLAKRGGDRDFALVLVISDNTNFIANDFAADRVGRTLKAAGFTRIEVLKFQDTPSEPASHDDSPAL